MQVSLLPKMPQKKGSMEPRIGMRNNQYIRLATRSSFQRAKCGRSGGTRTHDLMHPMHAFYQLNYAPMDELCSRI